MSNLADSKKRGTGTMLDTSSDDSDDSDQPMPMSNNFVEETKSMPTSQAPGSKIPRTQALPKGRVQASDLDMFMQEVSNEPPTQSFQMPKGQLKLAQRAGGAQGQRQTNNRPNTLELLQGFAETAVQRERREFEEEKKRIEAKRNQIKQSKIGKGYGAGGSNAPEQPAKAKSPSVSPLRNEPAQPSEGLVRKKTKRSMFLTNNNAQSSSSSNLPKPQPQPQSRIPGVSPNAKPGQPAPQSRIAGVSPNSKLGVPPTQSRIPGVSPNAKAGQFVRPGIFTDTTSPNPHARQPAKSPIGSGLSKIPGMSPKKATANTGNATSPMASRAGAQRMFAAKSPTAAGSRIGLGARKNLSPMNRFKPELPLEARVSAHFGTVSPVKDDVPNETTETDSTAVVDSAKAVAPTSVGVGAKVQDGDASKRPSIFNFEGVDQGETGQHPSEDHQSSSPEKEADAEEPEAGKNLKVFAEATVEESKKEKSDDADEKSDGSESDSKLQSLLTDSEVVPSQTQTVKTVEENEESSLRSLAQQEEVSSTLHQQTSILTIEQESNVTQVDVDFLCLVKTIKRRKKADLIDEIQRELDEIDRSILTNHEVPQKVVQFENNYNFEKFRPGMIAEWNLEIQKLDPNQAINVPHFDLEQFNDPFTKDHEMDQSSMPLDDLQSTKLRHELEKLQNDNLLIEELKDDDSDDLLNSNEVHISEKIKQTQALMGDAFEEEDSPSYMLPVPASATAAGLKAPGLAPVADTSEQSSSELISIMKFPESPTKEQQQHSETTATEEPSTSLMDDSETQELLKERQIQKLATYGVGDLDTVTEHAFQEDLLSQIDAVEHRDPRESIVHQKRPSRREQRENAEALLEQIQQQQKLEARHGKGKKDGRNLFAATMGALDFNQSLVIPNKRKDSNGIESLAKKELRRPRSFDGKMKDEVSLFDSDMDDFSVFKSESDSSLNLEESPSKRGALMSEKDIGNIDANLISLTNQNKDFQRLVEEAKAEKNKRVMPSLTIDTDAIEEEQSEIREESNDLVGELDQPLRKPRTKSEQDRQRKELRELVTYKKEKSSRQEEEFKDTVPQAKSLLQAKASDHTIDLNSLLNLLITDSSLKKSRTAHLYLCEDRELEKSRVGLKILYEQLVKQNEIQAAALVLLKISKVFFCLNQLTSATETVSKCVSDLTISGLPAPPEALFWKGMIYFYQIFSKRVQPGQRRIAPEKRPQIHADMSQMINSCEQALTRSTKDPAFKIVAKFLLLKLSLFVQKERFGCDLLYITQMDPMRIQQSIQHDDYYYGQIALSEVYVDGQERKTKQAFTVLNAVIGQFPRRGEAYIKLWQLNMYCGNQLKRSQSTQQLEDQRSQSLASSVIDASSSHQSGDSNYIISRAASMQSDGNIEVSSTNSSIIDMARHSSDVSQMADNMQQANKYYSEAYNVVSRLLENCDEDFAAATLQQRLLMVFLSVKSLQKSGQYIQAFELLQREFAENPAITSLMYLYGKYVVKAMANEVHNQLNNMIMELAGAKILTSSQSSGKAGFKKKGKDFRIDQGYLGSGIGALEECLRSCFTERHAKVNYYIGFAYKVLRMPLKTQEYYVKAFALQKKQRTLSMQQSNQVQMFLQEQSFFTIIAEEADQMIKEKQGLKKRQKTNIPAQALKDKIKEYMKSMQNMEKIDLPNSLLLQARMEAYLIESDSSGSFGEAFERLIQQFPTFIDGYIEFWHYLKYRLTRTQQLKNKGVGGKKHADQIVDQSGKKVLDNMRECATSALMYSDATEVPTSLWVEARIIFAKQMIFEKEIGQAVSILKDICYIIPPYAIEGLSYVQYTDTQEEQDLQSLIQSNSSPRTEYSKLTAEEMFMREADKVKRRNSPNRGKISKDAPLFQKKTFKQSMFENKNLPRSENILPKGKINLELLAQQEKGIKKQATYTASQPLKKGQFNLLNSAKDLQRDEGTSDIIMTETDDDIYSQMDQAERNYRESMYNKYAGDNGNLNVIMENDDERSDAHQSNRTSIGILQNQRVRQNAQNQHLGDAMQMLEKISQLQKSKVGSAYGNRQVSMYVSPSNAGNINRTSMYRKQPLQRGSHHIGPKVLNSARNSQNRSLTIYNPFNFDKKMMETPNSKAQGPSNAVAVNTLHQSFDFGNAVDKLDMSQVRSSKMVTGGTGRNEQLELAYQAMLKAQMAWQEQRQQLGDINEIASSCLEDDQMSSNVPTTNEAIIESENFAIYSNFKFLQLIGKYCAKSKQHSEEGLKALNDYLLLLEYHRGSYTKQEYYAERAITIFYIGSIFYQMKDYFHAVEHLLPIQEQLHMSKRYKELAASEHKVSKIWRLNFNERTIKWDYFSVANMDKFAEQENDRQARAIINKMQVAGIRERKKQTKIHKLH